MLKVISAPKPSRWKNELWKTVAPDRGREERYEMIEYHTMFCNGDPNSGGFPWFILLISSWQIGYFVWMYYTADPAVGELNFFFIHVRFKKWHKCPSKYRY